MKVLKIPGIQPSYGTYFRIFSNGKTVVRKNDEINYIFKQYILFEILWWLSRFDCPPQFISSINDFQTAGDYFITIFLLNFRKFFCNEIFL